MRTSLPLLIVICLFVLAASPPAHAQANANADICAAENDSAFSPEQRIAACTALLGAAKDGSEEQVSALVNRGAAYWYINKTKLAFADFDRAIALDPKNARAFRERAECNRTEGRLDRALADANQAVHLDPNDAKAFEGRGNVFINNRQYDRAIEDYNEALRIDPKFALAFMDRGVAYYFKADYQRAVENYSEAIKLDPKRARAYTNRGAAYKKLGRRELALADESEAIKLDPLTPEFFDNRGLSYQENGEYDRAIADYNEAIRLRPQANFLTNRGDSYQFKGEIDRAIDNYDRALRLNPGFTLAYNNRGAAYRRKGDLDRAIADYEQALRIDPHLASSADNLAAVREERDRRSEVSQHVLPSFDCDGASRAVEKAICSDPDLIRLDRKIDDAYKGALTKLDRKGVARLRNEQREFIATRNRQFGRPDYQLKRELERRLIALRGKAGTD
jgi:tetratricopeptide (TPR) repeat protein